jgi:hypothetical protein
MEMCESQTVGRDLKAQTDALEREGCEKIYSEKFTGTKPVGVMLIRPMFQYLHLHVTLEELLDEGPRFRRRTSLPIWNRLEYA